MKSHKTKSHQTVLSLAVFFAVSRVFAASTCQECVPQPNSQSREVKVPNAVFPTIQSAISQLPPNSIIRVKPGVFRENLIIQNKAIQLMGSSDPRRPTVLDGAQSQLPGVRLQGSAQLKMKNFVVRGGSNGILGEPKQANPNSEFQAVPSAHLVDVAIEGAIQGVAGTFAQINMTGVAVSGSSLHGLGIHALGDVIIKKSLFDRNGQFGVVIIAESGSNVSLNGGFYGRNHDGGIYVRGPNAMVTLNGVWAIQNERAGIVFDHVKVGQLENSFTFQNHMVGGGYGNGLFVQSSHVLVANNHFNHDEGFEAAVAGCWGASASDSASVQFMNNQFDMDEVFGGNAMVAYQLESCTGSIPLETAVVDLGGNTCNGDVRCHVDTPSTVLVPISKSP